MIRNKLISLALVVVAAFTAQAMTVAAHDLEGSVNGSTKVSTGAGLEQGLKLGHLSADAKAALKTKHIAEAKDNDTDKKAPKKKLDGPCMSAAVDVRDTAILSAFDSYSVSVKAAITARRNALKAAWLINDEDARESAVAKALSDFKVSFKSSKRSLQEAKRKAWDTFGEARKNCGGKGDNDRNNKNDRHNREGDVRGSAGIGLDAQL